MKTERRPWLTSDCDNVQSAERWRHQVVREIPKSVTAIQNAGLGEFRIRDLNDHINKLLREKKRWEDRIRELGGKHYKGGAKMLDREGKEVPGNKGYKYFGAAKDLPGVRELFESDAPVNTKKTRAELMRDVDAHYYGFRDDDDGKLVPEELAAEKEAVARLIAEYKGSKEGQEDMEEDEDLYIKEIKTKDDEDALRRQWRRARNRDSWPGSRSPLRRTSRRRSSGGRSRSCSRCTPLTRMIWISWSRKPRRRLQPLLVLQQAASLQNLQQEKTAPTSQTARTEPRKQKRLR